MPNNNFKDHEVRKSEKEEDKVLNIDDSTKVLEKEPSSSIYDTDALNLIDLSKAYVKDVNGNKTSKTKEEELADMLYDDIKQSISDSAGLRRQLKKYEMIADMEPDPANNNQFWTGSSNVRSPLGAKIFEGKFCRWISSLFGIDPICLIEIFDYDGRKKDKQGNVINSRADKSEVATKLEAFFTYIFRKVIKGVNAYREILVNTGRANTGLALVYEDCQYKKKYLNNVTYNNSLDFTRDFPSSADSGLSEEEYQSFISKLDAKEEITIPKIQKIEKVELPKIESINRDDFLILPNNAKNLELARGYGYKFELSWNDIKKYEAEKRYKNVDKLKSRHDSNETNEVNQQRDKNENKQGGGSSEEDYKLKMHSLYKMIYHYQIDEDSVPDKLIVTFSYESKVVVRTELWDENLYIVPHRIRVKPGRFDGIGTIKMITPMNDQSDVIRNLRVNSARIACAPSFKAKNGIDFDPAENEWMPGAIFWLDNLADVEQFQVNNNFPELVNEEVIEDRYAQEMTGITSASGGRESPNDPNAPGNKTIALIQEGNLLTNEDIACLRTSVEEVFYYILQLYAKYAKDDDKYLRKFGLTKKDLEINLEDINLHGVDVMFNKEAMKQQGNIFYTTFRDDPMIANNPNAVRELLKSTFKPWGEDKLAIIPTEEEIMEMEIRAKIEAMKRMEQEKVKELEAQKAQEAERLIDNGTPPPPPPQPPVPAQPEGV